MQTRRDERQSGQARSQTRQAGEARSQKKQPGEARSRPAGASADDAPRERHSGTGADSAMKQLRVWERRRAQASGTGGDRPDAE